MINDEFVVTDSRIPRDGSYYDDDMRNIFPSHVRKEIEQVHENGVVDKLMIEIQRKVELYFHE